VADEAALGVLDWTSVTALAADALALCALPELCRARKLDEAAFAGAVWEAFTAASVPLESAGMLLTPELAKVFPHAPSAALARLAPLLAGADRTPPLSEEQWRALLGDLAPVPSGLFRRVPASVLDAAVSAALRSEPEAVSELWRRFPERLERRLIDALGANEPDPSLPALLAQAPRTATPALVEALDDVDRALKAPAATLNALRRFLHARVAERAPGFRDVYALLDEIERRCAPLRQGSSY
jgi:hypothetical protein